MSNTPGERRPHSDAPRGRHLQTRSHIDRMNPVVATGSPPSIARSSNRHFYTVTGTSRGQSTGLPGVTTGRASAGRRASGQGSARPRASSKNCAAQLSCSCSMQVGRSRHSKSGCTKLLVPTRTHSSSRPARTSPRCPEPGARSGAATGARRFVERVDDELRERIDPAIFVLCLSGDAPRSRGSRPTLDIHHPAEHYGHS